MILIIMGIVVRMRAEVAKVGFFFLNFNFIIIIFLLEIAMTWLIDACDCNFSAQIMHFMYVWTIGLVGCALMYVCLPALWFIAGYTNRWSEFETR